MYMFCSLYNIELCILLPLQFGNFNFFQLLSSYLLLFFHEFRRFNALFYVILTKKKLVFVGVLICKVFFKVVSKTLSSKACVFIFDF